VASGGASSGCDNRDVPLPTLPSDKRKILIVLAEAGPPDVQHLDAEVQPLTDELHVHGPQDDELKCSSVPRARWAPGGEPDLRPDEWRLGAAHHRNDRGRGCSVVLGRMAGRSQHHACPRLKLGHIPEECRALSQPGRHSSASVTF
jgi:hypothetical protein